MADDDFPRTLPDWLIDLGVEWLSPYIKSENIDGIADVLKIFAPRPPTDFYSIIVEIESIAIRFWLSREVGKTPVKFEAAKPLLEAIETAQASWEKAWEAAALLHPGIFLSIKLARPLEDHRREIKSPRQLLSEPMAAVRLLLDPDAFHDRYLQPPAAHGKSRERALILEPFFLLMNRFGLRVSDFENRPLMPTIRALYRVIGIDPPKKPAFKAARDAWIEREGG